MVYQTGSAVTEKQNLLKMNSVNPVKALKTIASCATIGATMLEQNNIIFFKDLSELLRKYTIGKMEKSFVVGEVFRHEDIACVPQYHGDEFSSWLFKPSRKKVIPIRFEGIVLAEYVQMVTDQDWMSLSTSSRMSEQQFWLILYALIIKPEIGRIYFKYELSKKIVYSFHVYLPDTKLVVISVDWRHDKWLCHATDFDKAVFREGKVLLYTV